MANKIRLLAFRIYYWIGILLTFNLLVSCGSLVHHQVKSGDSLYSIGFYYGQDFQDIAEWNHIPAPYVIHKGQWLRVAPPDEKLWVENKQKKTPSRHYQNKNNNKTLPIANTSVVGTEIDKSQVVAEKKRVVSEGFIDKAGRIDSWVWPTNGKLLNTGQKFSARSKGIDIGGKRGQLVYAAAPGKVVYSGNGLIGYGQLLILKHNKTYLSAYAHNEQMLVKEGDIVKRHQKIARMGSTPDNRVLLHFEIRRNGKPVNPLRFLGQ